MLPLSRSLDIVWDEIACRKAEISNFAVVYCSSVYEYCLNTENKCVIQMLACCMLTWLHTEQKQLVTSMYSKNALKCSWLLRFPGCYIVKAWSDYNFFKFSASSNSISSQIIPFHLADPWKMCQQDFAVLPPQTRTRSQCVEYVNSISHCLLDAFLCVCACPHWLWSTERVLCGAPKRPWTLTVRGGVPAFSWQGLHQRTTAEWAEGDQYLARSGLCPELALQ